jgi:hypothetical protein
VKVVVQRGREEGLPTIGVGGIVPAEEAFEVRDRAGVSAIGIMPSDVPQLLELARGGAQLLPAGAQRRRRRLVDDLGDRHQRRVRVPGGLRDSGGASELRASQPVERRLQLLGGTRGEAVLAGRAHQTQHRQALHDTLGRCELGVQDFQDRLHD